MSEVAPTIPEALKAANSVAILSHISPEADTLGSALALYLVLKDLGKDVALYNADPIPPRYLFLPGAEKIVRASCIPHPFDLYLVLDSGDRRRVGGLLDDLPSGGAVINIDHHQSNERFGDLNWVEPAASSTGEMIYRLLQAMAVPISPEVATNLYAAIHADTGSFRFSNTTPSALRAAADLLERGAKAGEVVEGLYEQQSVKALRFLGKILLELERSEDGAIASFTIGSSELKAAGIEMEETDGFINYPRSLKGVKVALAFKELSPGLVKVSLRSKGQVDVAKIASVFRGGGHQNAAGCILSGGLGEVKERVLAEVRRALNGLRPERPRTASFHG
ncbi:MAG: bifunctional oligoribonuclease/PAP phosphatase NrnA [candidate division NC10 bacterium]|nr:bifunctional oligoribonuclease/PAP phosphatase NrnA [candidate division NC10 bacterium]